jgi:hypothetical protein
VISAPTLELAMRKAMAMGVQVTSLHSVDCERFDRKQAEREHGPIIVLEMARVGQ